MTHSRYGNALPRCALVLLLAPLWPGCSNHGEPDRLYTNPYPQPRTLAVAPFRNQSGSDSLDPIAVTDEFYTELQAIKGIDVVPVNRVLAALDGLGLINVASPQDALALSQELDADGVIVGSVTQYDPYPPPRVGMIVQLYLREQLSGGEADRRHVDPGELARAGTPFELEPGRPIEPRAAVSRIYDADESSVIERIKAYARGREGADRPYRWQTYTTSRNFLRFVSHEIIGELLAQEGQTVGNHP